MQIVIYRTSKELLLSAYNVIINKLNDICFVGHKYSQSQFIIQIESIRVYFVSGNPFNLYGFRPDYYNTDSHPASDILYEYNGKELEDLFDVTKVISEHYEKIKEEKKKKRWFDTSYKDLSEEERSSLIDICKEDPVIFLEYVLDIKLLDYQKLYVREVFKACRKQDKQDFRMQILGEPNKCKICGGTGMVPIGPGIRGVKKCTVCNGGMK